MATEFGRIDFMFLDPPYPAAASATDWPFSNQWKIRDTYAVLKKIPDPSISLFPPACEMGMG